MSQEQTRETITYGSLEEAFEALPQKAREHSIRVAEYTAVLFQAAIEVEMNLHDDLSEDRLQEENARGVYLSGKYHELGLLTIPEEYRVYRRGVSEEAIRIHRTHVEKGGELLEELAQTDTSVTPTELDIIREGMLYHHEKADGTGYPFQLKGEDIPVTAWLVSCADDLDKRTAYVHSENVFRPALEELLESLDNDLSQELALVVQYCAQKLKRVFDRHADETNQVTLVPPIIRRRNNRPMELFYRPIRDLKKEQVLALEASPVFKNGKEYFDLEEMKGAFAKQKALFPIWRYFLYELSDMQKRLIAYDMPEVRLEIPVFTGCLNQAKAITQIRQWMEEARVIPEGITFTMEEADLKKPAKTCLANMEKLQKEGFTFYLTEYSGAVWGAKELEAHGITLVSISAELLQNPEEKLQKLLEELRQAQIQIRVDGLENDDYQNELTKAGVTQYAGAYAGEAECEDEILQTINEKYR